MNQKSYNDTATLYLIPTPIGNLDDITLRALETLKMVDVVLCEDTRNTGILLQNYDIHKKLVSCHEYNEENMIQSVISMLEKGQNVGLVTDQGTPIISDPGYVIARGVIDASYNVVSLPGATAFVPALTVSGISPSPFLFYGFLNAKKEKQRKELQSLKDFRYTLIFYESVHRIRETLENMLEVFGNRRVALCRELSKVHEEIARATIEELISQVDSMKGEFVLVVEGNQEVIDYSHLDVMEHVQMYLEDGMTEKEAIKLVASERHTPKSVIYNEYHNRK
ncbi:MAG: 16S rRNA (cytidine(1402)-2'-O)-methyltransferase [Bacilli bacterium]|nr:16S rRNA (cytidine(1402)-2'-O)-methyltransferase [Bacilli bacterium]